jgi:hypothetical protein
MNVDTQFPQAPLATLLSRPLQTRAEQASARPVDRPPHKEAANNHSREHGSQTEAHKELRRPQQGAHGARPAAELNTEEKRELEQLRARDREVRAHEAAHKAQKVRRAANAPAQPSSLAQPLVCLQADGLQVQAATQVLKAVDDMIGSLFDDRA